MDPFVLSAESMRRGRGIKWRQHPGDVLPAWVADMDFAVAGPVQEAIARLVADQDYGYPWRPPEDLVQAAFAERMRDRFGWHVDPCRVQPVTDLLQAIVAAVLAFSEPGDGVLVQTPAYPPFLSITSDTDRRMIANPLVDDGVRLAVDTEGLRQAIDGQARILLLCNPHNPSGRVLERAELESIGRIAVEHDLAVVADEIHCDLVYPGHSHVPLASLGDEVAARTITINSASKGFNIAGLRCGVMHFGSEALQERFRRAVPNRLLGHPSSFGVDATLAAWRHGQPWLDQVMRALRANRDRLTSWLADEAPLVRYHAPEATYLAWLDCRQLELPGPTAFEFFLQEARVALSPGELFTAGGEPCVRLNFATSPEILDEILERMSGAIQRAAGRGPGPSRAAHAPLPTSPPRSSRSRR